MFRRIRETAPAGLVPLAWTFTTAAHLGFVGDRPVLIAHLVMDMLLVLFVVLSWHDMREGVLRAWRTVILAGIPVTLAGTLGLSVVSGPLAPTLLTVSVVGWTILPAPALFYTGTESEDTARTVNYAAGTLSIAGAATYLAGVFGGAAPSAPVLLVGLALVGVGQTAGIVDAVVRY
ncbi:hypothetical protein [Halobaculum marinum]|uniref:Uncharacterized protein n=1 Tax=Halobaculum marinum TaxID=3031996 RepID=A0ABD5WVN6_9EURY|nr:hypothetical protein [Halobaculum sp. DT55]